MSFFKVFMQKQEGLTNRELTCAVFVTPQFIYMCILSEAVAQRCSVKKVFLEISQNSQENTCARDSFLIEPATLLKKDLWYRYFPVNFAKFLRTPFFRETSGGCFSIVISLT